MRDSGINAIGPARWGTHFCQFYQTKEDLAETLAPYFKAGLENNEYCMWVTSDPLGVNDARESLKRAVPDLEIYEKKGQIEIIPHTQWYLQGGSFDPKRVLAGWISKLEAAQKRGFDGLRLSGNTFWLERNDWNGFTDYEREVDECIGDYKMIAACTYSLEKCGANDILDVIKNHEFSLIKRDGEWEIIESKARKQLTSALEDTQRKFHELFSSMAEGVTFNEMVYDNKGVAVDYIVVDVNPAFEKITRLDRERVVGEKVSSLYGENKAPYLEAYSQVAASGKPFSFETYFPPMDMYFSIKAFSDAKGKFTTVFHDITSLKKAEQTATAAQKEWEKTFDAVPDLISILDKENRILRANKAMAERLGLTPAKCMGNLCFKLVHDTPCPPSDCPHVKTMIDGLTHNAEIFEPRVGGSFLISTTPIYDEKGLMTGSVHVARDITERKATEEKLKKSLEEKDILLKEIHHRVKNNLQVVASLLHLQSRHASANETKALNESCSRINAMSLVHEILYKSDDLSDLNAKKYLEKLTQSIANTYKESGITTRLEAQDVTIKIQLAVPLGLIANELISNSFKHAFPDKKGTITITLQTNGDNAVLKVKDDGVGLPAGVYPESNKTLGLRLVRLLTDQVGGKVENKTGDGSEFIVTLPNQ